VSCFWLITVGEPLPTDPQPVRLLRTGWLAEQLVSRGHDVVWFTAAFDHTGKRQRAVTFTTLSPSPRLTIVLLPGMAYARNVSVARLINHWQVARAFTRHADTQSRPDLILASLPTLELAAAGARFGAQHGVPVWVDVRDLWPDVFESAFPRAARRLARWALWPYAWLRARALGTASGCIAISDEYLAWAIRHGAQPVAPRSVYPLGYRPPAPARQATWRALVRAGVNPNATLVWFIGSFGATYDLAPLLDAARGLEARGDVQFVISGDGERDRHWRTLAKGLPNVHFTGWLDAEGIAALLGAASIGVAAYRADAPQRLPNKLFEYLAGGLALVSSLRGEAAGLIAEQQIGESYDPAQPGDCERALRRLIERPDHLAHCRAAARSLFAARFSEETLYPALAAAMEAAAAGARIRPPLPTTALP
jgi:glycosyltransferase involved in cell wall biosynthesis